MKKINLENEEAVREVTLERARQLLKDKIITDEELKKVMDNLRAFCRIIIDIHQAQEKHKQTDEQNEGYSGK